MRIAHAVRSDGFAGVEQHVARLATAQRDAGDQVRVVGGEPRAMASVLAGAGVQHLPAATVADVVSGLSRWRAADIVHLHMTAAELAAVLVRPALRAPLVATRHFAGRRGASGAGRLFAPMVARRLAAQIAISRFVSERVEGPSTVVYPGLPVRPTVVPASHREPVVLVVQRLEREKDSDLAVRAFAASGLAGRGWSLLVAGDGAERAALESLVADLGLGGSVEFLGHRHDVPSLMDRAGLLLAPCSVEGLGLTVLEAMSAGLPVVAAGAGGHLETVGLARGPALFDPGSAGHAAELLSALAADQERRQRYGEALRMVQARRFTPEAQQRETEAVYLEVLR